MSRPQLRALAAAASVCALVLLTLGASTAPGGTQTTAHSSLQTLLRQTSALPSYVGTADQRTKLRALAGHALKVARTRPCGAVADLNQYRRVLGTLHVKTGPRYRKGAGQLAALGPASLDASRLLLALDATRACGGNATPSRLQGARTTLLSSSVRGLHLKIQLPQLHFAGRIGATTAWTQLVLPNTDSPSKPGSPGIPSVSVNFGVPQGAKVAVSIGSTETYELGGVNVYPAQPESADTEIPKPDFTKPPFATKPFTIDRKAYSRVGLLPARPAAGAVTGSYRDLRIGTLRIPAAQYDANTHRLKVIDAIDVTISFEGRSMKFSDELDSPWEYAQGTVVASLVNKTAVGISYVDKVLRRCGEEMLVITNHSTRAIADTFAAARNAAGIRTVVKETGAGAGQIGTTATEIQTYIRGQLTAPLCIHPSYVTIVGDDELVPTFTATPGSIPSDLGYSLKNNTDLLPDVAVGRLLGANNTQLTTLVNKIIGYETTAPTGAGFMTHATIAAQFQDDTGDGQEERTFIWFAEKVRNGLTARGVTVDRVYDDSPATNPLKFYDGTSLPASLKKPTFPWNGTGANVTADWNAGRFMVVHRDHGWSEGWSTPQFETAQANALTNGANLPVVLSINCSSAAYDYDEDSFTQQALVNANGGAVGVFGDTRDSPSWHNSQLALGFVDALLPSILSGEGPATAQRTGNALINGKLRLAGLASPTTDTDSRDEMYLWHYFGDPSMQMWGGGHAPFVIDPRVITAVYQFPPPIPDPPPYRVVVQIPKQFAGQPIALLRGGVVIGKGIAGRTGAVTINASFGDGSVKPGELKVALDAQGAQPVSVTVTGIPSSLTARAQ